MTQNYKVSVSIDGRKYTGRVQVDDELVTVRHRHRENCTQIGSNGTTHIAQMLLSEIIRGVAS